MSGVLLLDSGPLGFITQPQRSHEVIAITDWGGPTNVSCLRGHSRFENAVRAMVVKAMGEKHSATRWEKVPERIRKMSKTRMEEDAKYRWHGARRASDVNYCDFGDLSSIIVTK